MGSFLNDAIDASGSNAFDLTDKNHEVVPIWTKDNIIISNGVGKLAAQFGIVSIPEKYNVPQVQSTEWCGGTRVQNLKHYNLIIPKV